MGAYLIYLELELKKALKILPRFLAGAIVLVAILGTIAFSVGKTLYQDSIMGHVTIGIVVPEEDNVAKTVIRMLTSLDSVKSVCDFEYLDEASGREQMQNGELHALMIVPDGFVDDIITGANSPVTIVLPNNPGMEAMVFKELVDSGARTLSVAQAGIYAADELCITYQMSNEISQVEAELNRIYFAYALPREDYFRDVKVSAVTDVSVMQYYVISASILFLFLCGISLSGLCEPEKAVLKHKLEHIGITSGMQILTRMIAVAFLLVLVSGIGAGLLAAFGVLRFQPIHLLVLLLVCVVIGAMIVAVYTITDSPIVGVMSLFWLTIGMLFISGGLVPSVFLPEMVRKLGMYMPTTPLIGLMKSFAGVKLTWNVVVPSLLWGIGSFLAALWRRKRR